MHPDDGIRKTSSRIRRTVALLLLVGGIALALTISAVQTWADYEASLFASSTVAQEGLPGLRCPLALTTGETATVSVRFVNPTARTLRRPVRVAVSDGFVTLIREESVRLELAAAEQRTLTWPVSAADAAWDRFVLVRVEALRSAPVPAQTSTCGVPVLTVPGRSGTQVMMLATAAAVLSTVGGWLLRWSGRPIHGGRGHRATIPLALLTLTAAGSLALSLWGLWAMAAASLLLAVFLVLALCLWTLDQLSSA